MCPSHRDIGHCVKLVKMTGSQCESADVISKTRRSSHDNRHYGFSLLVHCKEKIDFFAIFLSYLPCSSRCLWTHCLLQLISPLTYKEKKCKSGMANSESSMPFSEIWHYATHKIVSFLVKSVSVLLHDCTNLSKLIWVRKNFVKHCLWQMLNCLGSL